MLMRVHIRKEIWVPVWCCQDGIGGLGVSLVGFPPIETLSGVGGPVSFNDDSCAPDSHGHLPPTPGYLGGSAIVELVQGAHPWFFWPLSENLQMCHVIWKNTQVGISKYQGCQIARFTFSIFLWNFGLLLTILFQACLAELMHKKTGLFLPESLWWLQNLFSALAGDSG